MSDFVLVAAADKMLWVTIGSEHNNSYYGLSKGWLKILVYECPRSLYQFLNIQDRNEATTKFLATTIMTLMYTNTSNDFRLPTCVHITELELCLKKGITHITQV